MPVSDKFLSYNTNTLHRRQVVNVLSLSLSLSLSLYHIHTHTHSNISYTICRNNPPSYKTRYLQLHWLISCSCQIKHKEECHITVALQFYIRENTINLSKLALLSHTVSGPYIRRIQCHTHIICPDDITGCGTLKIIQFGFGMTFIHVRNSPIWCDH